MKTRTRRLSDRTIAAIHAEYKQGDMPFHPMAENKHWRDNRMYFTAGRNRHYQQALIAEFSEEEPDYQSELFWNWVDRTYGKGDIKVVWCNVYRSHALHFITDEAKVEFLLRHGKPEPFPFNFANIKIPMIRRIIPSVIAADLVGVQPMTAPSGLIFSTSHTYGAKNDDDASAQ